MTSFNNNLRQPKTLPNGVELKVIRAVGEKIRHNEIERQWLRKLIEGDATAHGAIVSENSFNKVLNAICVRKIQACFLTVALDGSKPQYAGGAIEIPSVFTEWTGSAFTHYPAVYSEDTYVVHELSTAFRERTKSENFPAGLGLGTCFTHERVRLAVSGDYQDLSFGYVSGARISENSIDNVPMLRILTKLGAKVETHNGTILELRGNAPLPNRWWEVQIETTHLNSKTYEDGLTSQPHVFLTRWSGSNGAQRIVASFTEAISTFTGKPVVRVQFTSNGLLPETHDLQNVIGALVSAGRREILKRSWALNDEVVGLLPNMRIHALNEPQIISVLKNMGAETRLLGSHPMLPVITNFAHMPHDVLDFDVLPARPFIVPDSAPILSAAYQKKPPQVATSCLIAATACVG